MNAKMMSRTPAIAPPTRIPFQAPEDRVIVEPVPPILSQDGLEARRFARPNQTLTAIVQRRIEK
jgi:hypothetical protein